MLIDENDLLWQHSQVLVAELFEVCCPQCLAKLWRRRDEAQLLTEQETKLFLEKALAELEICLSLQNPTYKIQLTADVFALLKQSQNQQIDAWGYFNFRLPQYRIFINEALNRSWSAREEAKDYQNFLDLTRLYLHRYQHGRILQLLWLDHQLLLFDADGQSLTAEEIGGGSDWDLGELLGLSREENLIQILLNYAPERVIVHAGLGDMPPFSNMVCELLGSRLSFCGGCDFCRHYQSPPISLP